MRPLTLTARTSASPDARTFFEDEMPIYSFRGFTLDPSQHLLSRGDESVDLTPRAFDVLKLLVENASSTVPKETILEEVWNGQFVEESNITVQVSALRNALGESEGAEYIRTVHGKGYCFTAPVEVVAAARPAGAARVPGAQARPVSLAVLPVANLAGDAGLDYFADALCCSLTNSVSRVRGLRVVPRDAATRHPDYRGRLGSVAEELRVSHVLTGSIERHASGLVASFELVDCGNDRQLWGERMPLDPSDVVVLQESITERISDLVVAELGLSKSAAAFTSTTRNSESHRLFLKGRYLFEQRTAEQIRRSVQCFEAAIARDPSNASAYVSLVETYRLMYGIDLMTFDEAARAMEPLIETVLGLDRSSDAALSMLGGVKMYFEWDFEGAERDLARAVTINPDNLEARYRYSDILLVNLRFVQALREFNSLLEMDPASPRTLKRIAKAFYRMGKFTNAEHYIAEVLEVSADDFEAVAVSAAIDIELGKAERAMATLERALGMDKNPDVESMVGYLYAKTGETRKAISWIESFAAAEGDRHPVKLARIHGALGDSDEAFRLLDQAVDLHEVDLIFLNSDPRWVRIKEDPRFAALARRIGFPVRR